jgi:hypothetical protein
MEVTSAAKNACMCENAGPGSQLMCLDDCCDRCNGGVGVCASERYMWRLARHGDVGREAASHRCLEGRSEAVVFERSAAALYLKYL